jgi:hypothetical protein
MERLFRRRADGVRVYEDELLGELVPLLYLLGGARPVTPGSALAERVQRFLEQAGVKASHDQEAVEAAVAAWLEAHPLPPPMLEEIQQWLLEQRTAGPGRAAQLLDNKVSPIPVGSRGEPPAGATRAGPLARFLAQPPPKKR